MYPFIKYLFLALVMLLGLYPIVELTRVIVVSGFYYFPEMQGHMLAEVIIMWILYLAIVPLFLFFGEKAMKGSQKTGREMGPGKSGNIPGEHGEDKSNYIRVDYFK